LSRRSDEGLRIGIDASRAVVSRPTGVENYAYHVLREMLALERPHEYTLYLRRKTPVVDGASEPNLRQRVVRPARLWTHLGLSYEMLRRPPDVLFVPAHVLPVYRPRRCVVTVHDLGYLYYPEAHTLTRRWYLHLSTAYHVRVATRLIADSEATKADLVKWYGADPAKIAVVHLAVGDAYRPVHEEDALGGVRARYAGGGDYLLYLGTVQPRKNVGGLLEAYATLRGQMANAPALVIAGKRGWLAAPIYARAEQLGLLGAVRFVDYVPQEELPALLSGALALVFPSFYEGFGLPALEAMACGTAVVAANSSSLPEVVGDAGLLVDPHDSEALAAAIQQVVEDTAVRTELRARGLARAAAFTWRRCAEETLRVLEEAAVPRQ
jgi:glycosyltransferase involved in cell wall biosynthesis